MGKVVNDLTDKKKYFVVLDVILDWEPEELMENRRGHVIGVLVIMCGAEF